MATPVVQSSSSAAWAAGTSPVVTKPTGLATGDLMVAYVFISWDTDVIGNSTTPSGWTKFLNEESAGNPARQNWVFEGYYKIADASDVAASNFTFVIDTSNTVASAAILRITGHSATAPHGGTDAVEDDSSGTSVSGTISVNTMADEALVLMALVANSGSVSSGTTVSGYTISDTNPTWTEVVELATSLGALNGVAAIARSSVDVARIVTTASATLSQSKGESCIAFTTIPADTAVAATPSSVAVRVTIPTQDSAAAVNITPDSVAIKAIIPTQGSTFPTTVWSNQSKNNSTWTPQDKP